MSTFDPESSSPDDDSLPPFDAELLDLERDLEALVPMEPESGWIDAVADRRKENGVAGEAVVRRAPSGWSNILLPGLAALVAILVVIIGGTLEWSSDSEREATDQLTQVPGEATQLVPVSTENMLLQTEPDEVVEVEGYGLMRPVMLYFETAQCWIDPETETSVQVIHPWQELVLYPVDTY